MDCSADSEKVNHMPDPSFHMGQQAIMLVLAPQDLDHRVENGPPSEQSEAGERKEKEHENCKARVVLGLPSPKNF